MKSRKTLVLAAVLAFTLCLCTAQAGTAYAEDGTDPGSTAPAISLGAEVLRSGANTAEAPVVVFGEKEWCVIGYAGTGAADKAGIGVAGPSGTATLLTKGLIGKTKFDRSPLVVNWYQGTIPETLKVHTSTLKEQNDAIAAGLTEGERSGIIPRTLIAGINTGDDTDCIAGDDVEGAYLWPLSIKEAFATNEEIRKADDVWWLRSPAYPPDSEIGEIESKAGNVREDGTVMKQGGFAGLYALVSRENGIRSAFYLDLDSVLITSAVSGGKVSGTPGSDALAPAGQATGSTGWKLTVRDAAHSSFAVDPRKTVFNDTSVTIVYSGAVSGENEFISGIIADSSGNIKYYGRLARVAGESDTSGTLTISLDGRKSDGDTLYIFNEQYNEQASDEDPIKTDYASELNAVRIPIFDAVVTGIKDKTYTGKALTQAPVVRLGDKTLRAGIDYTIDYQNNKNAGEAAVIIKGIGEYGGTVTSSFKINKAANPLKIKARTATVRFRKLKKKTQTLVVSKVIAFTKKGQGAMTYTLTSARKGSKNFKKSFTISKKTGKVTIKKGLKKGTYKVKVKAKAAGNANYRASAAMIITLKIKVK